MTHIAPILNKLRPLVVIAFFVSYVAPVHARSSKLVEPDNLNVPRGLSADVVQRVIEGSLRELDWATPKKLSDNPLKLRAAFEPSRHSITIDIEQQGDALSFSYADSKEMSYKVKNGEPRIHPIYKEWTQALSERIEKNLSLGDSYKYDAATAALAKGVNPPPEKSLNSYSRFELEPATLEAFYQSHEGNEATRRNLEHNLNLKLRPLIDSWNQDHDGESRTLTIKPHIRAVRFIGTAARLWVGTLAGRSWIYVQVEFVDKETGETIAHPSLYRAARLGNGLTASRNDYAMVEMMAADITSFTENNYKTPAGGGERPTDEFLIELAEVEKTTKTD